MNSFAKSMCAAAAAMISLTALAGWEVDTAAKTLTLTDGDSVLWKFECSFSGEENKEIKLTKHVSGTGDIDFNGIPDGYKVVNFGSVFIWNRSGVTSITEPNELKVIGVNEFYKSTSLTNLTGCGSVTDVGDGAFLDCNKLRSPMLFPNCTKLGGGFNGCSSVPEFSFPLITQISNNAFMNCSSCTNFGLVWAELTRIGNDAFTGCSKLTGDLSLPKVTYFGGVRATGVTSVDVPNAETVANYAFYDTKNITNANFGAKTTSIGDDRLFYNCTKLVGDFSFPLMTYVPGQMFVHTKVTSVAFPAATNIHSGAFNGCSTITNFVFTPELITSIGDGAFTSTKIAGDLRFPNLKRLGGFQWANSVTSVYAPQVDTIGSCAFYMASGVTNVMLGHCVTKIEGSQNFHNCSKLTGDYDFGAVSSFPQNFMNSDRVTSLNLTNATSFGANCFYINTTLTNIMLCAATELPEKLFFDCAAGCSVQFYGDVPVFGKNVFTRQNRGRVIGGQYEKVPNTVFFYIWNSKFRANWTNACFALKGTPEFEPYKAQAPKRTIGVMYVGPENAAENERDLAYVIDCNRYGLSILLK